MSTCEREQDIVPSLYLTHQRSLNTPKIIIGLGLLILTIGVLLYFFPNAFRWVGNLPGDIRIEKENSQFYFPITTMILISLAANLIIRLLR